MIGFVAVDREEAFALLGLAEDAEPEAAHRAFRRLARSCHPDLYGGKPEMEKSFKRLSAAYRLARAELEIALRRRAEAPPPHRGRDLFYRVRLPFRLAAMGGVVSVRFKRPHFCHRCAGSGQPWCRPCGGVGEIKKTVHLKIRIPAGIEEDAQIRLRGCGGRDRTGERSGDLYVAVRIRPHPRLHRRGLDIYSDAEVPRCLLWKGGEIEVETLGGSEKLKILPFTRPGKTLQLEGRGVVRGRGASAEKGDHFIRILREAGDALPGG
ncbi:MAG: DnaJ domain-containing protein [bacterium]|nr:DnaJ domain-containing protein [bacterium]